MNTAKNTPPAPTQEAELPVEELFLLHLRYKEARLVEAGSNKPILLNDPQVSWVVYRGWADLFAVPLCDGKVAGSRTHLMRVNAGSALFGMELMQAPNDIGLLIVSAKQTSLLRVDTRRLQALAQDKEFGQPVCRLIDDWVRNLSACLLSTLPPKECIRLDAGALVELAKSSSACARHGVLWVKHAGGQSQFVGDHGLPTLNGKVRWPISERVWIQTLEDSRLDLIDTPTFMAQAPTWPDLEHFHQRILQSIARRVEQNVRQEQEQLQARISSDRQIVHDAFNRLVAPLSSLSLHTAHHLSSAEPLLAACRLVAEPLHLEIELPPNRSQESDLSLAEIARASRFQTRQVALKGQWWRHDNGPLLAFKEANKQPVALLPYKKGYRLVDPVTSTESVVTEATADHLSPFAHMFYRPLAAQAISAWQLVRFGLQGAERDLRTVLLMATVIGVLSLLIPLAIGLIVDQIIPDANRLQLVQLSLSLLVVVGAITLFQVTQSLALLRLQGKLAADLQAAIWDRTLNLPVSFFRAYSAGDLGNRVMGISTIQQMLSGTVLSAMIAGLFSLFSFLLLFYYDRRLALVATLLVAISAAVLLTAGRYQIRYQRLLTQLQGKISGVVLQAVDGIAKFRAAGAEGRAFATWAKEFSQLKEIGFKARNVANNFQVFNAGYQVATPMVIFAVVALSSQEALSTGQFLAFNAAFVQFLMSVLTLSSAVIAVLNIIPTYERAQPILQTLPEIDQHKEHPGELTGNIEVSNVSFRYSEDGPEVLKNVSLEVNPGEFVALVGPSGSGKSTLFRMLLGFETPLSGAIYYSGQDLARLDVREVRRQIGVVLQNGQIMAGDIFSNIVGSSLLTLEDAWRAAAMAGLAEDIKALPMGMHTVLSQGGGTLSGGQRQRLLIARAIVNRPRLLFFDEATSALDSNTQAIVSESLENLQATRIVIAHRLSTIKNADKIYVLHSGRLVQEGSYEELINVDGVFADLAKRQMA
jgi:NHLM bacteriocin system ABC transporter ATP-binding protein